MVGNRADCHGSAPVIHSGLVSLKQLFSCGIHVKQIFFLFLPSLFLLQFFSYIQKNEMPDSEGAQEGVPRILRWDGPVPLPPIPDTNYASFVLNIMLQHGEKLAQVSSFSLPSFFAGGFRR